ncbi:MULTISPECIES: twin-arginine translocase TatA/TatE family subunit [unclassified Actinotalea]|uniref:twin-arginine translocase TatA/TatE family subunit n=1 Tax=unclassified Actinotalea TaxID=2638618 RepID=UPI0015F491FE|nr:MULTISPECIES: twin-arginine translocase TatA/TatE family subunit [unclassified Actinotalea]
MGISGWELLVLVTAVVVLVGPEQLPRAAEQLGRLVREVRAIASGARERVREELGPDVDLDWEALDPRQYDPRRIVREALVEELRGPAERAHGHAAPAAVPPPLRAAGADPGAGAAPTA